jgi:hypothetical protein
MPPLLRARSLAAWIGIAALVAVSASLSSSGAGAAAKAPPVPQLGFNSYVQDLCQSPATWASDATGQFTTLKGLGANSIALAFPLYTNSLTSNSVFAKRKCGTNYETPSVARLEVAIKVAHAMHLRVFLRPLLDETNLKAEGGWRGTIEPTNTRRWFKSYLNALIPYLKLAHQQKVEYFAISTELDSLATKPNWTSLIRSVKRYYRGPLTFTVLWTATAVGKDTWAGTSPGMDTYQQAQVSNSASTTLLLDAWNGALNHNDPVPFPLSSATIDEVAIVAQDGAYWQPWAWTLPPKTNPYNENVQANWYSMVCTFFRTHDMAGIYFWGIWYSMGANAVLTTPGPTLSQMIQPTSAAVIKSCYESS